MEDGLTIAEAARALGVSEWAIRRRIKAGKIPATMLGREWRVHLAGSLALGDDTLDASDRLLGDAESALQALAEALAHANDRADWERQRVAVLEQERAELFGRLGYFQAELEQARQTIRQLQAPAENGVTVTPLTDPPAATSQESAEPVNGQDSGVQTLSRHSVSWWRRAVYWVQGRPQPVCCSELGDAADDGQKNAREAPGDVESSGGPP